MKKVHPYSIPLMETPVHAGFPSPADDFARKALDLNELVIEHPAATFFVRVKGESMLYDGFYPNDILVVDKSREARDNSYIIAILQGEFTFKKLHKTEHGITLIPANPTFSPIIITEHMDFSVWGVVTCAIHYPPSHEYTIRPR